MTTSAPRPDEEIASRFRRRLLVLHGSDEAYGSDRILFELIGELASNGHELAVLLPDDTPPGWLSSSLKAIGVKVRRGPLAVARRRYLTPWRLPRYAAMLNAARGFVNSEVARFRPDVVHVNTSSLLVAGLLPKRTRRRVVWHVHEIVVHPRPARFLFSAFPVRRARRVMAISAAVATHLSLAVGEATARRIRLVPNGLPDRPPPTDNPGGSARRVAFIGRLNRWKGYEVLIDAAPLVVEAVPDARFLIAGEPPVGEEWRVRALLQRIDDLDLSEYVDLTGYVPSAEMMDQVQVVAVPSIWPEPFGLVTLEAMRAERGVVATNHGASPELLDDGRCGLLVPPDDATALATALICLLTDDARRKRLAAAARQRFLDRYTLDRFVAAVERVYAEVETDV